MAAIPGESGTELLEKGEADAVVYGRPFIANPDLVERFASGAKLNTPDPDTLLHTRAGRVC